MAWLTLMVGMGLLLWTKSQLPAHVRIPIWLRQRRK